MKKLLIVPLLALAGCASDYNKYAEIQLAREAAQAEKWKAMARIAESGDTTAKVAAMFAMQDGHGGQQGIAPPRSPWDIAQGLLGIFVPALVQGYGIHANQAIAVTQSNNATALGVSTNSTMLGIAGHIQAPAANVTTTTTLSGTGVMGSGSYSTDSHAISGSYNPVDNSNQGNPVTTTTYPVAQ